MGLVAYREQLAEAVSSFPRPPVMTLAASNDNDPMRVFNAAYKTFVATILQWRMSMVEKVDVFEQILDRASSDNEEFIPVLLPTIEEAVSLVDEHIEGAVSKSVFGDAEASFELIAQKGIQGKSIARTLRKRGEEASEVYLASLDIIRNRLMSIIWKYDPAAKGGPSFDNASALLAFLKS